MSEPAPARNPYVGPYAFQEKDADFFFGRGDEARMLAALVIAEGLVLFCAQSGAGKSSLINAKLIPGLRDKGFRTLPIARVGASPPDGLQPANVFVYNLLAAVAERTHPERLAGLKLADALLPTAEGDDGAPRVLIVDQFEELFTTHPERWRDREDFFHQLRELMRADPRLSVVLAMREDRIASIERYRRLLGRQLQLFRMERLLYDHAVTAIQRPAAAAGLPFAAGVAEQLADDLSQVRAPGCEEMVAGEYVEPVQLQVVCYQLWNEISANGEKRRREITAEDLARHGNVDRALESFFLKAVERVSKSTGVRRAQVREWCGTALITATGSRAQVERLADTTAGLDNAAVDALIDTHLLRQEQTRGSTWCELAHDRFIEPIQRANESLLPAERISLAVDARAWNEAGHDPSFLYSGRRLDEVVRLLGSEHETLDPVERAFLEAGQKAARAERRLARRRTIRQRNLRLGLWIGAALWTVLLILFAWQWYEVQKAKESGRTRVVTAMQGVLENHARTLAIMLDQNLTAIARRVTRVAETEQEKDLILRTWMSDPARHQDDIQNHLEEIEEQHRTRRAHFSWLITDHKGTVVARAPPLPPFPPDPKSIIGQDWSGLEWFYGKQRGTPRREPGFASVFRSKKAPGNPLMINYASPIRAPPPESGTPPAQADDMALASTDSEILGVLVTSIVDPTLREWMGMGTNTADRFEDQPDCSLYTMLVINGLVAVHPCRKDTVTLPVSWAESYGIDLDRDLVPPLETKTLELEDPVSSVKAIPDFEDRLSRDPTPRLAVATRLSRYPNWVALITQDTRVPAIEELSKDFDRFFWFQLAFGVVILHLFFAVLYFLLRRRVTVAE